MYGGCRLRFDDDDSLDAAEAASLTDLAAREQYRVSEDAKRSPKVRVTLRGIVPVPSGTVEPTFRGDVVPWMHIDARSVQHGWAIGVLKDDPDAARYVGLIVSPREGREASVAHRAWKRGVRRAWRAGVMRFSEDYSRHIRELR
ncbi:hypothetical protein PHYC_02957 [Phycisphaerales bacterium]|nr:hypothetical protein PHYC_02957 [Phycisphaerales bacterium]